MDQFKFEKKSKKLFIILMVIGVLSAAYGMLTGGDHASQRVWVSAYITGWFFFSMGLGATFFIAMNIAAQTGWVVVLKRVFEAVSLFLPVGAIWLVIVYIASSLHMNHIFHWMAEGIMDPASAHYDKIIAHKEPYLNLPFWWARTIIFVGGWTVFAFAFRKRSLMEDAGIDTKKMFRKNMTFAAIFLVFFGYSSTVAAWDLIMSIDTHWFSTLFGWYVFAGMWVEALIIVVLIILYLLKKGYLPQVTKYHLHDMGKWTFAISFLWTYLFFSQFMLYWYSDIAEEIVYYKARFDDYSVGFWGMMIVNFALPMLLLMSKDTKRNPTVLAVVCVAIFFGHWLDVYYLITPGTMHADGHIGIPEIGMLLGGLGLFLYVVFNNLAKAPLVAKNNILLDESLHHQIN